MVLSARHFWELAFFVIFKLMGPLCAPRSAAHEPVMGVSFPGSGLTLVSCCRSEIRVHRPLQRWGRARILARLCRVITGRSALEKTWP